METLYVVLVSWRPARVEEYQAPCLKKGPPYATGGLRAPFCDGAGRWVTRAKVTDYNKKEQMKSKSLSVCSGMLKESQTKHFLKKKTKQGRY